MLGWMLTDVAWFTDRRTNEQTDGKLDSSYILPMLKQVWKKLKILIKFAICNFQSR